ncbi:MAG: hypothetical protein IT389_01115 [Nitrospira sp.]|nr:hypothetical protein [Nitrospira sp.]
MRNAIVIGAVLMASILAGVVSPAPAAIKVSPPTKPWHVTQLAADTPICDSSTTFSYNVTWKPVFETWNPKRAPHVWKNYIVKTYNCAETSIIICDALCTTKASGCSIKQAVSWMRVSAFLTDDLTSTGSFMEISGILRPALALVGKTWQCVGK